MLNRVEASKVNGWLNIIETLLKHRDPYEFKRGEQFDPKKKD
jgi:hypothetical protein